MAVLDDKNQETLINAGYSPQNIASMTTNLANQRLLGVQSQGVYQSPEQAQQYLNSIGYAPSKNEQAGLAKANVYLGPEALQSMMDQRSTAKKEISDAYRDQMRGLNARQHQSARANYESSIRSSGASQRSSLASALASRGLQGGFAAAQQAGLEANLGNQLNQAASGLMMQDINLQRQGLDNYSNTVNAQEAEARQNLLNRLSLAMGNKGGTENILAYNNPVA